MLTDKTPAAAAKCSANDEVLLSSGRAGNEKVGHVQTGDEQQAERRREQSVERRLEVLDCGIQQCMATHDTSDRRSGMIQLDLLLHDIQLAKEAGECSAGPETRDGPERVVLKCGHQRVGTFVARRSPELSLGIRKCKGRRHHAKDGVGFGIEQDRLADDGWIGAKTALPKCVREDDGGRRRGLIVRGEEVAAERGHDAEDAEEVPGDPPSVNGLRQLSAAGRHVVGLPRTNERHIRAVVRFPLPFRKTAGAHWYVVVLLTPISEPFIELDQTRGVRVRQRIEQDKADDGEERGGGADAERHDEDGGEGEAGSAGEGADGVAEIAREVLKGRDAVLLPEIFVHAAFGTELDTRAAVGFFRRHAAGNVFGSAPR